MKTTYFFIICIGVSIVSFNQNAFAYNDCTKDGKNYSCFPIKRWDYKRWYILDARYAYKLYSKDGYETAEQAKSVVGEVEIPWFPINIDENNYVYGWMSGIDYNNPYMQGWRGKHIQQERNWNTCPSNTVESFKSDKAIYCKIPKPLALGCSPSVGNPCSVTTGNKFLSEIDWVSSTSLLKVHRFYNSLPSGDLQQEGDENYAAGWTHNYAMSLSIGEVKDDKLNLRAQSLEDFTSAIVLERADGKKVLAVRDYTDTTIAGNSGWFIDRDESLKLKQVQNDNKWQVTHVDTGQVETYEPLITGQSEPSKFVLTRIDYLNGQYIALTYDQGRLYQVRDHFGNTLTYEYANSLDNAISAVTLPSGKQISYVKQDNELKVTRPGYGTKTYLYDEPEYAPNPNGLITGIIDEKGDRYATYAYDDKNRGVSTEHAHGSEKYTLDYNNLTSLVVTPNGGNYSYDLQTISGRNKVIRINKPEGTVSNTYDGAGNIVSRTDIDITNRYTYDTSRNLQNSEVKAYGRRESTITLTEWADDLPVKTKVVEGKATNYGTLEYILRTTTYTHDDKGNILSKTITDPLTNKSRTWTYTYDQYSQRTSETDPQGLTQTWVYDTNNGNLLKYTDGQELVTTYGDHTSDGKPQTITEASGQLKTLTYDDAGRILSQTITIAQPELPDLSESQSSWTTLTNSVKEFFNASVVPEPVKYDITQQPSQTATTTYEYDNVGQLISVVLPDGETITYQYDDAHRMTGMTDSLGNRISYTLNGAGDIIETKRYDPQGILSQSGQQSFDVLGRLNKELGNNGQQTTFSYDKQDNLIQTQDALSRIDRQSYDRLGRVIQDIDAESNEVKYEYNGLSQLIAVTDSRGNTTRYTVNAFGETTQIQSPDTGITTFEFNDVGQLMRQVDAAGRVKAYQYDVKGRVSNITDSQGKVIATYNYDDVGHLIAVADPNNSTSYTYDSAGRIIEKIQHIKAQPEQQNQTVRYHYTAGGKVDEMRLPSGKLVIYDHDKGVLKGIRIKHDDHTTQLVDDISYSLEGINGFNWSQTNQTVSHVYDLDGRLTQIKDPAITRGYQYDVGNRITSILDNKANIDYRYTHDKIDRLLQQNLIQASQQTDLAYVYDRNSNRIQNKVSKDTVIDINNISYAPNNNHIVGMTYDASGRIVNDGMRTYTYDTAGRIERIQNGSIGIYNAYNPLGQRIQKNSGNIKTYFSYNEQGQLIGEYDENNNAIREYIYLGGQPIAMLSNQQDGEILQIHTDHLGTPRAVTNKDNTILWRWEGDAFGTSAPSVITVKMPLRMAGQYADNETGLFYNYYRFYNPKTGRYVTSDPIGLGDGMNTYGYVGASPLHFTDFKGLARWKGGYVEGSVDIMPIPFIPVVDAGARGFNFTLQSICEGVTNKKYTIQVWALSGGVNIDKSILKKVSFGAGTAEFDDNNGSQPNPNAFTGFFGAANLSILATWTPWSYAKMGQATGNISGLGVSTDLYAAEAYGGYSKVWSIKEESCDCE
ncbi:RHS repeat-associated core domain-containing protein [Psychrobacter aestuarii]|uniref:RHS repeat protein n=1 Tax=Psychrobacter aestuarii TaxID=556327 RepID=A0ABP3FLQ0_9GAMM|nr:RHS repeat-associated core domain-containing protein [Psychrobacter aestuarii]